MMHIDKSFIKIFGIMPLILIVILCIKWTGNPNPSMRKGFFSLLNTL